MKRQALHPKHPIPWSTLVILLGLIKTIVINISPVWSQTPTTTQTLPAAYWDAIDAARTPTPPKIFRNLTAIIPHNRTLTWDQSGRVLVVTWTTWNGYTRNIGNQLILTRDLWVTAVPDLQKFCKHYTSTAAIPLAARLNQLLGLPPESATQAAKRQVVTIWVEPRFMLRPSPDPEITDREAELGFRTPTEFITVSQSYQHWFYAQYDQRYQFNGEPIARHTPDVIPYPWTQLGYTYDWGNAADWAKIDPTRPPHVGLSEFVIRQWSPIAIHSTQAIDTYCR